ncbi:MAG: hypothetical protein QOJ09_2161, partial [Actinomycetota bacterium]|nr:hypothetical protein [Actinomycetota bacterium]
MNVVDYFDSLLNTPLQQLMQHLADLPKHMSENGVGHLSPADAQDALALAGQRHGESDQMRHLQDAMSR